MPAFAYIGLLTDKEQFEVGTYQIQTNLSSVFYCCRRHPSMVAQEVRQDHQCIFHVGNLRRLLRSRVFCLKAGVNGLTKALSPRNWLQQYPVNAVACGVIDTAMNQRLTIEERKDLEEEEIQWEGSGTTDEVASIIWDIPMRLLI